MSFNQGKFAPLSANSSSAPRVWTYSTDDDIATVTAAGYFDAKKFQLEQFDLILAIVAGVLFKLVVGSDTGTVGTSNTVTVTSLVIDGDTGTYLIDNGLPNSVGLSADVLVEDVDTEDYIVTYSLPAVTGSTASTSAQFDLTVNGGIIKSVTKKIGNGGVSLTGSFTVLRGSIATTGIKTMAIEITNLTGTVTVDNTSGAQLSVTQYKDVLI